MSRIEVSCAYSQKRNGLCAFFASCGRLLLQSMPEKTQDMPDILHEKQESFIILLSENKTKSIA